MGFANKKGLAIKMAFAIISLLIILFVVFSLITGFGRERLNEIVPALESAVCELLEMFTGKCAL